MRAALVLICVLLSACASRYDQLKSESSRVETALTKEQSLVLNTDKYAADRQARLDYLSQLRTTLSAANIGLATIRYAVPADKQPIAYDVLEEVYGTIKWNIPLGPDDAKKQLPQLFKGNQLNIAELMATNPAKSPPAAP
ncbi:MAG: hypothetical protein JSS51_13895 [Planctomycetes bacterium]|nr:hypothetical protein [Planctomycetota bacterium]